MRRRLLLAALGAGILTGCERGGDAAHPPAALDFDAHTRCVLDGLRLIDYPGPKAQIHRAGNLRPDFFCDTVEMFHVYLNDIGSGAVRALYVQDAAAGWDRPAGHWIDARQALYVRGSSRFGPLGPTLASFSDRAAAEDFVRDHGGGILRFADIDADMVILDGGALHDTRM